jgi:hypothetical protein
VVAGGRKILLENIGRDGIAAGKTFGQDFMLDKPGIVRNEDDYVFIYEILAGKNGLILRLKNNRAFVTGALLATGGIENNTGKSRGLHKVCAGVDKNLPALPVPPALESRYRGSVVEGSPVEGSAVGLKGYCAVFHFMNRCQGDKRALAAACLPAYLVANFPLLVALFAANLAPASGFCHNLLR